MDAAEASNPAIIGEECHIVAREPNGPRGLSGLSAQDRDHYPNLILLCRVHHKVIDGQPDGFPVGRLEELKAQHERWVRDSLGGFDPARQRDEELYAGLVEEWAGRADLRGWRAWSSGLLGPQPALSETDMRRLQELDDWLFARIWPGRYGDLETAFANFRAVLQDLRRTFLKHAEKRGDDIIETRRFYRIEDWDEERYARLLKRYEYHTDLIADLMLELTRAANYVCDRVRQFVDSAYRLQEGALIAESGPYGLLSFRQHRAEYRGEERTPGPYPGLKAFRKVRARRDGHFGKGAPPP